MNLFLLWACRQFLAQRHCRLCRHCLSSTLARPCRCLCEQAGVGGDIIPNQFPQHASHISLSTGSFYRITFKFLFFFFFFFSLYYFLLFFCTPLAPMTCKSFFTVTWIFLSQLQHYSILDIANSHKCQWMMGNGKIMKFPCIFSQYLPGCVFAPGIGIQIVQFYWKSDKM